MAVDDDTLASINLSLAHRLRTAAETAVTGVDNQYRQSVARPRLDLTSAGLKYIDRLTLNNNGIRVCRLRDSTLLQLIAREWDGETIAMVEAHSADPDRGGSATSHIRQIRTGELLWNEADRQNYDLPHAYIAGDGRDGETFALVRDGDCDNSSWRLCRKSDRNADTEYPSFDAAILDIGATLDPQIAAERADRLKAFQSTLSASDRQWAADAGRRLGNMRNDPGIGI